MDDKFIFVVKPIDRVALDSLARAQGVSRGGLIRQLVRREARALGLIPATGGEGAQKQKQEAMSDG